EPFEGRHPVEGEGEWQTRPSNVPAVTLAAGALIVPIRQRGAQLVMHLLEPTGPDSLLSWGFMSGIFEQEEYMEDDVAESVAEAMLWPDGALRREFSHKRRKEPASARARRARLAFSARRHPSSDTRQDLYPVMRLLRPLPSTELAVAHDMSRAK